MLFDTAKDWLTERGMEAMDGPVNFGENLINWGLLAEGFVQQGLECPIINPITLNFLKNTVFSSILNSSATTSTTKTPFPKGSGKLQNG